MELAHNIPYNMSISRMTEHLHCFDTPVYTNLSMANNLQTNELKITFVSGLYISDLRNPFPPSCKIKHIFLII